MRRVLHVTPRLSRGGAGRALLGVAASVDCVEHRILTLAPAERGAATLVHDRGFGLVDAPDRSAVARELEIADIVHVHFWNTPELIELLTGPLPPARLLVWAHVAGNSAPHVLTRKLVALADVTIASTPYTLDLPHLADAPLSMIPPAPGWSSTGGTERKAHGTFTVGYVGTVDFAKMHPHYVSMSGRIGRANFVVCGGGAGFPAIARQADAQGLRHRFDLRGYVTDVGSVLAELDVFGYPLREGNYSGTELVLQEAMHAGVPPVVMAHGGAQRTVEHDVTGLVAGDEDAYVHAIEWLRDRPEERTRLGRAARAHALRAWSPSVAAARWNAVYEELLAGSKRTRRCERDSELAAAAARAPGSAQFVESLGDEGAHFRDSLLGTHPEAVIAAERSIAAAPPALWSADSGGILHYRRHYPRDPYLRLWSGLVLAAQRRHALAAGEFAGAITGGLDRSRCAHHLAASTRAGADVAAPR